MVEPDDPLLLHHSAVIVIERNRWVKVQTAGMTPVVKLIELAFELSPKVNM